MTNIVKDDSSSSSSSNINVIEKSPLTLPELPEDVLENVTGWLPLEDCLSLRKVSRGLRRFVDSSKLHCQTVKFWFREHTTEMWSDHLTVLYTKLTNGCWVTTNRKDTRKRRTHRDDRNFIQALIADASTFLKMPKLEIGQINFAVDETAIWPEFIQFLETLNFRLNVKSIRSNNLRLLHSTQEFMKPEKLEEIVCYGFDGVNEFNEMAETNLEILKNPKLKFNRIDFYYYSEKSAAKFSEILKSINSQLNIKTILVEDVKWIPTILQTLNPEKVKVFIIDVYDKLTADHLNAIAGRKQWKTKTCLWCDFPEEITLEQVVDFKEFQSDNVELTEENLIIIRDALLKSPHLNSFRLRTPIVNEHFEGEMNERINRIMSQDSAYDDSTRRFSIPNSSDYFQMTFEKSLKVVVLTIKRISSL